MPRTQKLDIHQEITNRIAQAIETAGEFQLPWIKRQGGSFARPVNVASKNPYMIHGRCSIIERDFRPFETLAGSIIGQQLSIKAAETIERRVMEIVPSFTPDGFLSVQFDALRGAGLSAAKTRYILELAHRVNDGRLDFDALAQQPDDDVITALVEVPGIGRWIAEMFLIFGLRRPNVLALGDAGLQRAARLLYGPDAELEAVGGAWQPYRSIASWYLWRHLDAAPL